MKSSLTVESTFLYNETAERCFYCLSNGTCTLASLLLVTNGKHFYLEATGSVLVQARLPSHSAGHWPGNGFRMKFKGQETTSSFFSFFSILSSVLAECTVQFLQSQQVHFKGLQWVFGLRAITGRNDASLFCCRGLGGLYQSVHEGEEEEQVVILPVVFSFPEFFVVVD